MVGELMPTQVYGIEWRRRSVWHPTPHTAYDSITSGVKHPGSGGRGKEFENIKLLEPKWQAYMPVIAAIYGFMFEYILCFNTFMFEYLLCFNTYVYIYEYNLLFRYMYLCSLSTHPPNLW